MALAFQLGASGAGYLGGLHLNLGYTYNFIGDLQASDEHYETAYRLLEERGETSGVVMAMLNMGYLALGQRQYRQALRLLHQVVGRAADQMPRKSALARRAIVDCYLQLNRFDEARELALEIIDIYRNQKAAFALAQTLLYLARAETQLDDYPAAYTALHEAEQIYLSLDAPAWTARAALCRAEIALENGDYAAAQAIATRAAELFSDSGERISGAEAQLLVARAYWQRQQWDAASSLAHSVLEQARALQEPVLRHGAHFLLGQLAEQQGRRQHAARRYTAAAAIIDRLQQGLTITMRSGFVASKGEALQALVRLYLEAGQAEQAFLSLEWSRAQRWLRHILNRQRSRLVCTQ